MTRQENISLIPGNSGNEFQSRLVLSPSKRTWEHRPIDYHFLQHWIGFNIYLFSDIQTHKGIHYDSLLTSLAPSSKVVFFGVLVLTQLKKKE